jgi:hypothetical protein
MDEFAPEIYEVIRQGVVNVTARRLSGPLVNLRMNGRRGLLGSFIHASTARANLSDLVAGVKNQLFRKRIDFCNFGRVILAPSSVPN